MSLAPAGLPSLRASLALPVLAVGAGSAALVAFVAYVAASSPLGAPAAALSAGLTALVGAGIATLLARRRTRRLALEPLTALEQTCRDEVQGRASSAAPLATAEFRDLGHAMDEMLTAHHRRQRDLQRSEAELRLLGQISRFADREGDFHEALERVCRLICRFLCWPIGHIWHVDPADGSECLSRQVWHASVPDLAPAFSERSSAAVFRRGEELPGRVLERGQPIWLEDVWEVDWFTRSRPDSGEVRGAVAFPAAVASDVIAVIELLDVEPRGRDVRSLALMHNIGLTLGQVMHRRRSNRLLVERNRELADALRDAQAATRAKTSFLANMSHELRTPMTAILGYTELLPDARSDAELAEYMGALRRNGEHLLAVINEILDLSKIEAGRLAVEHIACSPWELLMRVHEVIAPRAAEKGLRFEVRSDGPLPERILSDPTRLQQILLNLAGNAIKFTSSGSVSICAAMDTPVDAPSPRVRFRIEDTGIGIPEELRDKLFKPFSQADMSTTRRFGGTGLGLSISRSLAELLGGEVRLEAPRPADGHPARAPSAGAGRSGGAGPGSCFTVSVETGSLKGVRMLSRPDQCPTDPERTDTLTEVQRLDGVRVLLAEDGPDNQRLVNRILVKAGAKVEIVENGELAYQRASDAAAAQQPFDVILMDMQMPVLDGYSATRRLRHQGYRGPIVALTANALAGDEEKCLAAGCDAFLAKPVRRQELVGAVADAIDGR